MSPYDRPTGVKQEIKSPPTVKKDIYSEYLDKNMKDQKVQLPAVDELFPQTVDPF